MVFQLRRMFLSYKIWEFNTRLLPLICNQTLYSDRLSRNPKSKSKLIHMEK